MSVTWTSKETIWLMADEKLLLVPARSAYLVDELLCSTNLTRKAAQVDARRL